MFSKRIALILLVGIMWLTYRYFQNKGINEAFSINRFYNIQTLDNLENTSEEKLIFRGDHPISKHPKGYYAKERLTGLFMMNPNGGALQHFKNERSPFSISSCQVFKNGHTQGSYYTAKTPYFIHPSLSQNPEFHTFRKESLGLCDKNHKDRVVVELIYKNNGVERFIYEHIPANYRFSNIALSPDESTILLTARQWIPSPKGNSVYRRFVFYVIKDIGKVKNPSIHQVFEEEKSPGEYRNLQFDSEGKGVYFSFSKYLCYFDLKGTKVKNLAAVPFSNIKQSSLSVSPKGQIAFIGADGLQSPGTLCIANPKDPESMTKVSSSKFLKKSVTHFTWSPDGKRIAFQAMKSKEDRLRGSQSPADERLRNRRIYVYDLASKDVSEIFDKHVNPQLVGWINNH